MFITAAYAQTAAQQQGPNTYSMLLLMAALFAIMYFVVLRPQQKKMKEHREMVSAVKRGDVVVTAGGLIGKVTRVLNDAELQVEIADGVRVRVLRHTISEVRTRSDVREADARKALARKDEADNDDDETSVSGSHLQPANDSDVPKKDA